MTLSLIWQPRAGGVINYPPSVLSGTSLGPMWLGLPIGRWETRQAGRNYMGRQISRWDSTRGNLLKGEHWPLQ